MARSTTLSWVGVVSGKVTQFLRSRCSPFLRLSLHGSAPRPGLFGVPFPGTCCSLARYLFCPARISMDQFKLSVPKLRAVPPDQRISPPFLTKYERARIIGTRAQQLAQNAPPLYKVDLELDGSGPDPQVIAEQELERGLLPFIIRRYLPDGESYEDWALSELLQ